MIDKEQPDRIFAAKNAGSLLIGISDKGFVMSSQVAAFQGYTRQYVQVPNNEVVMVTKEEIIRQDKVLDKNDIRTLRKEIIDKKPKPGFKWFFEQEVYEQAEAISKTLNFGGRIAGNNRIKLGGLESREDDLKAIDNLVIAACGTSLYSGMYASLLMKKLRLFQSVVPYTASDITEDYLYPRNTGVLSITQSGETEDLKKLIRLAQKKGLICFNVINEVESEIARMTELGVFLNAGREVSVASTKAFLCQAVALVLVTCWFAEKKSPNKNVLERIELLENLKVFCMKVQETLYQNKFDIEDIAKEIYQKEYMAVLGKGLCTPIAMEAALKIKEVTYMHAEGYSSGEFKHGPLALVEEGKKTLCLIYILDDDNFEFNMSTLEQLKAKEAYTIVITDCKHRIADELADKFIKIPSCGDLTPLLGIIPIQLLTLHIAQLRGNDVDQPRNLAKTVTV
jgi:glucosamine--fructose-6-phosphate aminotransferase (isomerizing)